MGAFVDPGSEISAKTNKDGYYSASLPDWLMSAPGKVQNAHPSHNIDCPSMKHYNKTVATLLAALFGGLGVHRLYLRGSKDAWAWLHLACWPASILLYASGQPKLVMYSLSPVIVSILLGFLQALVIGVTRDEKFDAVYNPESGRKNDSHWPLALILVATLMAGATGLIAALARMMDLMLTGGAFG